MKSNKHGALSQKEITHWKRLEERYFEATITHKEEKSLRKFLASERSSSCCFEEIKAVMGFLAVGRNIYMSNAAARKYGTENHTIEKEENTTLGSMPRVVGHKSVTKYSKALRWCGIAASVAAIGGYAVYEWNSIERVSSTINDSKEIYLAIIDDKRYTDKDFVLAQMHKTISVIGNTTTKNTVEEVLTEMFRINK